MSRRTLRRRRPGAASSILVLGADPLTNQLFARVQFGIDGTVNEWRCANLNCTKILAEKIGRGVIQLDGFVWSKKERLYLEPVQSTPFWPTRRGDSNEWRERFDTSPAFRRACHQNEKDERRSASEKHGDVRYPMAEVEIKNLPISAKCPFCRTVSILREVRPEMPPQSNNDTGHQVRHSA